MQHYPEFLLILITLQFCNFALFLSSLFNVITIELKRQLQSNASIEEGKSKNMDVLIDEEGNISKLVNYHNELFDLCKALNKEFNFLLLIFITSNFTYMLFSLFNAFKGFFFPNVCFFSYNLLSLWFVLFSSKTLAEKVNNVLLLDCKL